MPVQSWRRLSVNETSVYIIDTGWDKKSISEFNYRSLCFLYCCLIFAVKQECQSNATHTTANLGAHTKW